MEKIKKLEEMNFKKFIKNLDSLNNMQNATRLTKYEMNRYDFIDKKIQEKIYKYNSNVRFLR